MEYVCAEIDRLRLGMVGLVGYSSVKGGGRKERTGWIGLTLPGIFLFFLFKKKEVVRTCYGKRSLPGTYPVPPKKKPTLLTLGILFYSILCPTSQLKAAYHTLRGDAIDLSNLSPPFPSPPSLRGGGSNYLNHLYH